MMKIKISNLPSDITEEELKELFSKYGKVKNVKIVKAPPVLSNEYGFSRKGSGSMNETYYDLSNELPFNVNQLKN